MLLVLPVIASAAGLGAAICHIAAWAVHGRELLIASGIAVLSAEAGLAPVAWLRRSATATLAQAGLAGMVIQMLLSFALLGLVAFLRIGALPTALVWWSLVFYWVSLIMVAAGVISEIRAAQPRGSQQLPGVNGPAKP